MWWLLIPAILIALLIFLLLTPMVIDLNSETGKCELRWVGLGRMSIELREEAILLRFRLAGFTFYIDPTEKRKKKKPRNEKQEVEKTRSKMTLKAVIRKSKALLKSFHLQTFHCDWDSGDFMLNSWLFPLAHWLDPSHRHWNINFNGRKALTVQLRNNGWRLLRAWFS
jgi:hypothetical protein